LKVIFKLAAKFPEGSFIHTNDIAHSIDTKAASVTDMIKKLDVKKFLDYTPYRGVVLTKSGNKVATKVQMGRSSRYGGAVRAHTK